MGCICLLWFTSLVLIMIWYWMQFILAQNIRYKNNMVNGKPRIDFLWNGREGNVVESWRGQTYAGEYLNYNWTITIFKMFFSSLFVLMFFYEYLLLSKFLCPILLFLLLVFKDSRSEERWNGTYESNLFFLFFFLSFFLSFLDTDSKIFSCLLCFHCSFWNFCFVSSRW